MKTFTFMLTETDTAKLATMLADCRGVDHYAGLVASFFDQLTQEEHMIDDPLARQRELTAAAVNLSNHWLAQRIELLGRINRAKHTGHMALNNVEGGHVAALSRAIAEMLAELEGGA